MEEVKKRRRRRVPRLQRHLRFFIGAYLIIIILATVYVFRHLNRFIK